MVKRGGQAGLGGAEVGHGAVEVAHLENGCRHLHGERIFVELVTSDRKLKASREGSK